MSKGSVAAKIIASTSLSPLLIFVGKLTILFLSIFFCFIHLFSLTKTVLSNNLSCLIFRFPSFTSSREPAKIPTLPVVIISFFIFKI